MWNLINAPETEFFGIAIALMLMLGLLELLSLFAGGFTDWLDNLLPDSLVEADLDGDLHGGIEGAGALVRFLDWLYVGRVPLMMLLVVFLAVFGLTGYVLQSVCAGLFLALPLVRLTAGGLYKIMPKDETTAVSQESLIGRVGTVVLGEARQGSPAQVRVKDGYGQQHYVMAEPDGEGVLKQGEAVLLVSLEGNTFKAILNPSGSLVD